MSLMNESFRLSCHLICLYMLQNDRIWGMSPDVHRWPLHAQAHMGTCTPMERGRKNSLTHVLSLFEKKGINSSNSTLNGASWIYSNENHCYRGRKCNLLSSEYKVSSFERKILRLDEFLRVLKYQWPGEQHHEINWKWHNSKNSYVCVCVCMWLNSLWWGNVNFSKHVR